ncbi:amidohydrolase family protein [Nesterenkonia sp.]|uniref:amidohydrolase family protein n=1 Tax=Nesterenkonia sp. TaxID=704201 RepID=UPI0026352ECD|nr:amidohydrolase family protein [Nesterenkonia sp.]
MSAPTADPVVSASRQGAPILFTNATVLTMDAERSVLTGADVLVVGDRIEAVGRDVQAPEHGQVIDASGGILTPGFVDTHRHMWQTAMRGYGADWTLTQYFVWNYLEHGKKFRPEDIYAGNLLSAVEAIDAGVTTSVDWSHGLSTVEHADAAVDALQEVDGRFVFAYGNIHAGPWEWAASGEFRDFVDAGFRAPTGSWVMRCSVSRWPSMSPGTRSSRRRAPLRWPGSWTCRSPLTPGCGEQPTTTASA